MSHSYFDKLVAQSKTKEDLEKMKIDLKTLYIKRRDTYKELKKTNNFLRSLRDKREAIIQDFDAFFDEKGFDTHSASKSTMPKISRARATIGEYEITLDFIDEENFFLIQPGVFENNFSLTDSRAQRWLNIGFEDSGEVILLGEYSSGSYEILSRAKKDIEEEINSLEIEIKQGHRPRIRIFDKEDKDTFDYITEKIENLDQKIE